MTFLFYPKESNRKILCMNGILSRTDFLSIAYQPQCSSSTPSGRKIGYRKNKNKNTHKAIIKVSDAPLRIEKCLMFVIIIESFIKNTYTRKSKMWCMYLKIIYNRLFYYSFQNICVSITKIFSLIIWLFITLPSRRFCFRLETIIFLLKNEMRYSF